MLRFIQHLLLPAWLCAAAPLAGAQALRFDFGSPAAGDGWTAVTADTAYDEARGYGFEPGAALTDVVRKKGTDLTRDFVTADAPFRFSVRLPEGNWRVTLTLGDTQRTSCTTVRHWRFEGALPILSYCDAAQELLRLWRSSPRYSESASAPTKRS